MTQLSLVECVQEYWEQLLIHLLEGISGPGLSSFPLSCSLAWPQLGKPGKPCVEELPSAGLEQG